MWQVILTQQWKNCYRKLLVGKWAYYYDYTGSLIQEPLEIICRRVLECLQMQAIAALEFYKQSLMGTSGGSSVSAEYTVSSREFKWK